MQDKPTQIVNGQSVDSWDVFLSHNSADKIWVKELAARLESEPFDNTRPIKVFLDIWDIPAGANIVMKLNEGLAKAKFLAIVMSPEFFKSNWTALEWTHWVMGDPINTQGRILPILYRKASLDKKEAISFPAPFRASRFMDFTSKKAAVASYEELLSRIRGQPAPRGERHQPTLFTTSSTPIPPERYKADDVNELLLSNLFPVLSYPQRIWSAATTYTKPEQVYEKVSIGDGIVIHGGNLYTFADLSDRLCPLRAVVDTSTINDKQKREDWLADQDKGRLYTWLINAYLRNHLKLIGLEQDDKERYFYPPAAEQTSVFHLGREVTAKKRNDQLAQDFWVHLAADIRFYRIWNRFFLKVTPCFFFTADGTRPLDGKQQGKMAIRWGGKQRNANILRDVLFWATLLKGRQSQIMIPAGAESLVIQAIPAITRINKGIRGDHIRFSKLMKLGQESLSEVARDVEIGHPDDEDQTPE
mgnify:CR=1 FL=1